MEQAYERRFRFYRTKNNRFIWTDDTEYKVIFHSPEIMAFEHSPLSETNRILHYYYHLEIWRKPYHQKWKLFADAQAYDFPAVPDLYGMIYLLLHADMQSDTDSYANASGGITRFKSVSTLHQHSEDFYDIRRFNADSEWYELYIGAYHQALAICNLCEYDIWELHECVKSFYEFSCDSYNEYIRCQMKEQEEDI